MKKYIHYGHNRFLPHRFKPVENDSCLPKPWGGLWASPVDAAYGWKEWCEIEGFHTDNLKKHFVFTLREDAKVLYITSEDQLSDLPKKKTFPYSSMWMAMDFEALSREGFDAVEVSISSDPRLYWSLYGWDCDSIVVMNPDVILTVPET